MLQAEIKYSRRVKALAVEGNEKVDHCGKAFVVVIYRFRLA